MLFRRLMTYRAGNKGVIGSNLGPFDLRMAGGAGTGYLGRCGVVRAMAGNAGPLWIMGVRVYLREAAWP